MAFKFKTIRAVTLPTFKLKKGKEYFLKFASPMELGKEMKNATMGRATVMRAIDLETGELGIVLCPTILRNELAEQYNDDSYVGRCFSVVLYKVPEKRWTGVTLAEVSDPTEDAEWQAEAALENAKRKSEGSTDPTQDDEDDSDETVATDYVNGLEPEMATEGAPEVPPEPKGNRARGQRRR